MTAERMSAEELASLRRFADRPGLLLSTASGLDGIVGDRDTVHRLLAHIVTLQREAEAERARADAMREALEPFAKEAALWPDYVPDSDGLFIASPDDIEPILDEYAAEQGRASAGISFSNDTVTVGDLRRARAALSQASGEPEAPEQQSSAEWTDDDQANTDFVSDIACEISADDDVVHSVLGALTERNLFDWSAARKEIRTRYGEPSLSSEGK